MTGLAQSVGAAPFVFVVGKGGTGKTTAAGALALAFADAGMATHLISTDPAHSLADLFATTRATVSTPCGPNLTIEEFNADAYARRWLDRVRAPVAEIIERGSYLDAEDVAAFTTLALPGVDELMAVLRLVELADASSRTVVDTAPTGHTLRLLDAHAAHAALARALRALADKAAVVAWSLAGRAVRLAGEAVIDELDLVVEAYRRRVLAPAAFVVATRADVVVAAETRRLAAALRGRGLLHAATVCAGDGNDDAGPSAVPGDVPEFGVPLLDDPRGCDGLRRWREALAPRSVEPVSGAAAAAARPAAGTAPASTAAASALPWLHALGVRLLVFAGKGGVGKTTCAAAAALLLAEQRAVLLCSADPAGSLADVLGDSAVPPRLRTLQVDAGGRMARLRAQYHDEMLAALDRSGIGAAAALDRRVLETLWELAPPGIDEFAALAAILDAAAGDETIVLDTAPTGHFLRLLATPQVALDWTRQLMRLIVKYHATATVGDAAEALLQTARELRALQALLRDPARTGVIVVTVDEPLVRAESSRLQTALHDAGVPVAATLLNRWRGGACAGPLLPPLLRAPLCTPPVGIDALRDFVRHWNIEG
jgi:arsenite/tail-anchored protein-transporting ATPase